MTDVKPTEIKIYAALAAVQADMARIGVGKHGYNQQQRFNFRQWDDVQQALAAALAAHKVIGPLPSVTARTAARLSTTVAERLWIWATSPPGKL